MTSKVALLFMWLYSIETTKLTSRYECGPHGKFEYCLDDFTDCVVGCHCYPGYYFDTITKICEPSTKLFKESRRFNMRYDYPEDPDSNLELRDLRPIQITTTPAPSTTNDPIDDRVDALSKNADDLSDWLYNQFFKDIETQVINNTGDTTRRDGSGSWRVIKKKKKKNGKKKKNVKKMKHKRDSLRRHLLRIAEDDSLFESDGDDEDDDDDDESSSDSDTEDDNDEDVTHSPDYPHQNRIKYSDKKSKAHDHKEFMMVQAVPKPTLPSFILLPNIESPFGGYPLALPPAPAIQMFPLAPFPPYPGLPYCDEGSTTASSLTTTPLITTTSPTTISTTKPAASTTKKDNEDKTTKKADESKTNEDEKDKIKIPNIDEDSKTTTSTTVQPPAANDSIANEQDKLPEEGAVPKDDNPKEDQRKGSLRERPRQNYMEQLKEKRKRIRNMQNKLKHTNEKLHLISNKNKPQIKPLESEIKRPEGDILDDMVFLADEPYNTYVAEKPPLAKPIGYKYLSELIHRPDTNIQQISSQLTPIEPLPQIPTNMNQQPQHFLPSDNMRRAPVIPVAQSSRADRFLTELGREIASLIRKFEIKDLQTTKEIEQLKNANAPQQPFFNDNNYGSRSYWERSVRSPTPKITQFPEEELDEKYLNSNERLLQLENKVHAAAKKMSLLNLDQLERIANIIELKKNMELYGQETESGSELKPSNTSLNVSLLPQANDTHQEINISLNAQPNILENNDLIANITDLNSKNITVLKSKVLLTHLQKPKKINLFTPNTKQPYKNIWQVDGVGLAEVFPRITNLQKNESNGKTVMGAMIHKYLSNVLHKRLGTVLKKTYYENTSKRPLLKPIVQRHSPLKHSLYRTRLVLTKKPPLLNMNTNMNKQTELDNLHKVNANSPKTNTQDLNGRRSANQQTSYFHHDFHELEYYD